MWGHVVQLCTEVFIKPHLQLHLALCNQQMCNSEREQPWKSWNYIRLEGIFFLGGWVGPSTSLWGNIHPSLQYSSRSLIHVFLYDFFLSHEHPALFLFPLVTVCTIFLFTLFTIKHFGAWADFQISWAIKGRCYLFVHTFTHFRYYCNMIYSFSFDLPAVMLPNKTSTTVKWVWMSKLIRIYIYCSV